MTEVALTAVERTLRVWLMPLGHDSGEGTVNLTPVNLLPEFKCAQVYRHT